MDVLVVLMALPALFFVCDIAMSHFAVKLAKRAAIDAQEQYERVCRECDRNQILLNQWTRGYDGTLNLCQMRKSK